MPTLLLVTEDGPTLQPLLAAMPPLRDGAVAVESIATVADAIERLGQRSRPISLVLLDTMRAAYGAFPFDDVERIVRNAAGIPVIVLAPAEPAPDLGFAVRCGRAGVSDVCSRNTADAARLATCVAQALSRPTQNPTQRRPESAPTPGPAFVTFAPESTGGEHMCGFALRLRGVSGEADDAADREKLEARQTDWIRKLARGIFSADGGRLLELRYLASASRDPAGKTMVTVYLVGFGAGADREAAESAARALWSDVESITRLGQDLYQFSPLESAEDLRLVLKPFRSQRTVETTALAGRLIVDSVSAPMGFLQGDHEGPAPVALDLPLLVGTPPRLLQSLLEALAAQRVALQVVIRFEPGTLPPAERSLLEGLLSNPRRDGWRMEYADGSATNRPLADQNTAQDAVVKILSDLLAGHVRVRCVIEAAGPIARPLQTIAADVLLGGDPRDWITQTSTAESGDVLHGQWGLRREHLPLSARFGQLRPLSLAWAFLRLPLAGDGEVPGIDVVPLSYGYCPPVLPESGLKIGEKRTPQGLFPVYQKEADRLRHTYILGQTGTGKSTLMSTMAIQDIEAGHGVSVLDPHGDLIEDLLSAVPRARRDDVILFDLTDSKHPIGLNLLEYDRNLPQQKTFLINEMMAMFENLYDLRIAGGPMFENYMAGAMLLLMQDSEITATLLDVSKVFVNAEFRKDLLKRCQDEALRDFWKQALAAGGEVSLANVAPYITSKLNQFVFNDVLRPIIAQPRSSIDFRAVMDEGKILLVNLAKGYAGERSAALVGMVVVARLMAAALSRYDTSRNKRRPHYLYVDEFQQFTSPTVPQMLAEVRKYGLGLILANQNLQQLKEDTAHAVLGNVGTMLFFRPGPLDAERIRPYVEPTFSRTDLLGLPNFALVGRLLVEDTPTAPFLFNTAWRPRTDVAMDKDIEGAIEEQPANDEALSP